MNQNPSAGFPAEQDRVIAFSGGVNFRDIGGYPTANGRSVAWGKVYRSGTMAELVADDHAVMDALGLKVICDFRSTPERTRRPSMLPDSPGFEVWCRDHGTSAANLIEAMRRADSTPHLTREMMIALYRDLAYEQAPSYREMFARLAAGDVPLVFHCSAGKDRTGVAAALLLQLLGVSHEHIVEDYVFTNRYFERLETVVRRDPTGDRLAAVDPAVWEPMLRADPAYLTAMFETVDARHGGGEGFIREVLEISEDQIASIREHLLA